MCGIAGYFGRPSESWLKAASHSIAHRGPDAEGYYWDLDNRLGLAHRRLAILDLSDAGRQPMAYASGRYVMTYNGEIYNFRELRAELEGKGYAFHSQTDTEVIMAAWEAWGEACLNRLNGIFSFALWDRQTQHLTLVRDPLGVKPLFWMYTAEEGLFFSSELTPLAKRLKSKKISAAALDAYLAFLWIPAPLTIFEGIQSLEPGQLLRYRPGGEAPEVVTYTSVFQKILDQSQATMSPVKLWGEFSKAVERQLISDVPVGIFLSGGVDSSAIAAACYELKTTPTAYTIAFRTADSQFEAASNDLAFAKEVAQRFHLPHKVIEVQPDIVSLLSQYLSTMDQPVGDHAPLASWLICQAASKTGAKVMLSGQGADELFGGYPWHLAAMFAFHYRSLPGLLRDHVIEPIARRLPGGKGGAVLGHLRRIKRFIRGASEPWPAGYTALCRYASPEERYALLHPDRRKESYQRAEEHYTRFLDSGATLSPLNRMLFTDMQTFLPGLNLFYTDRTGMAHGVEVRVPFLDLELLPTAFSIPDDQKIRNGERKWIFKKACQNHLPESIMNRRKAGFGLPVRSWMQGPLRQLVKDTLSPERLSRHGLWDARRIQDLIDQQESQQEDRAYLLFALVVLEKWLEMHLD